MSARLRQNASDSILPGRLELVSIYDVDPFDINPRTTQNGKWLELKESIRAIGVRHPVAVGLRPETNRLTIMRGGNTRHAVLLELHRETADDRFAKLPCIIEPWCDDLEALTQHIIENEHREGFRFIDRARAIDSWRRLRAKSHPDEKLSYRQISALMQAQGCLIDHRFMGLYDYALDRLSDVIPNALYAGLGRPQIKLIKRLDEAAELIWLHRHPSQTDAYRALFAEALTATDVELKSEHGMLVPLQTWDFDQGRRALEAGLARALNVETRLITLELGIKLDNTSACHDEDEARVTKPAPVIPGSNVVPIRDETRSPKSDVHEPVARSRAGMERFNEKDRAPENGIGSELARLRSELMAAGIEFAQAMQLSDSVRPGDPSVGCGYIVVDFPSRTLCESAQQRPAEQQKLAWAFWSLVNCCDLFFHVEEIAQRPDAESERRNLFGASSRFVKAWRSRLDLDAAVNETVGPLEAAGYGDFVDLTTPAEWQAFVRLQTTYKQFRSYANEHGIDVFKSPDVAEAKRSQVP